MSIIHLMVLCSVSLALVFLVLFGFALIKGQFDEGESPAVRILMDDKKENKKSTV